MYSYSKMIRKHPVRSAKYFCERLGLGHMDDREYVEYIFERMNDGNKLDIDNPVTYDDKLNWMKIYDHNPLYTTLADKLKVKDYVSSIVGADYVIPIIATVGNGGYGIA